MMIELNNKIPAKNFKPSKYFVVSVVLHLFVVLMFLCPHIFFKSERKFLSNNMMSVQVLVQQNVQKSKEKQQQKEVKKQEKLGLLPKEKQNPKENVQELAETSEGIVANQHVANIKYNILKSKEPQYPPVAKRLNLVQQIVVKTRLLIDKEGNIAKIEFLESNIDESLEQLFHKEILTSLNTWEFSSVTVDDKPVRVYFYKNFVFQNA